MATRCFLVGSLAPLLFAACYETPRPACLFRCGENGVCPEGYGCGDDNRCHRIDPGGLVACPDELPIDASEVDAPMSDASMPDADIDAPMPDASTGSGGPDAAPADAVVCAPSLAPADDGSTGAPQTVVISEIDPGTHIELYNNTASPIDLENVAFQLCARPAYGSLASLTVDVVVPAGGYATIPWPAGFSDTDAGGEIVLYTDSAFADPTHIIDFVCWGSNPHSSRKTEAEAAGKWTGACAGALTAGALHRLVGTDGIDAADYSTTLPPSPMDCAP